MIQNFYDPATGQRGAIPPSDMPQPDAHTPEPFKGSGYTWTPSDSPDDVHDTPYEDVEENVGPPSGTDGPSNIVIGGPFSRSHGQDFVQPPAD